MTDTKSRKLLWDARDAAAEIQEITRGANLDAYRRDRLLRLGVERLFTIVGEALAALRRRDPETALGVPGAARIIGFRNVLVHNYAAVNDAEVWRFVQDHVPELQAMLEALLSKDG